MAQPDGSYRYEDYGVTPEQYHAGLEKLWIALGLHGVQTKDVFTLAAEAIIERNKLLVENAALLKAFSLIPIYQQPLPPPPPPWQSPITPWQPDVYPAPTPRDPFISRPEIWMGDRTNVQ